MYRSLERSTQDTRDGLLLYSTQALFSWPRVDLARQLRRAYSRPFWITSFEFVKVCGIHFSIWESFIGFYICCYPITTTLTCLFFVGVRISWKKLCLMRAWRRRWHLVSPTLYIIDVYRVNLNTLSRNFVEAIRTTTTNCRVGFIDFYLVFPTNFRIVFLPHTNTNFTTENRNVVLSQSLPGLPVGQRTLQGAFHLSELTGQTIPIVMGISLLIKTIQPDQSNPNCMLEGERFSGNFFGKSRFHLQNHWSGNGQADQF